MHIGGILKQMAQGCRSRRGDVNSVTEYRHASNVRGMGEIEGTSYRGVAKGLGETGGKHVTFQMTGMAFDGNGEQGWARQDVGIM